MQQQVLSTASRGDTHLHAAKYELVAEPEGGEELTALSSIDGARMKNMGANDELKSDDGPVYQFWMKAVAEGKMTDEFRIQILKESKAKANFPGFRKVRK